MAVAQAGQLGVQRRDAVGVVGDAPVGRDRRPVVGLEKVAERGPVEKTVDAQRAASGGPRCFSMK